MAQTTGIEWTDATWSPLRVRVKENAAEIAKAKGYTSLVSTAEAMRGRIGPHCEAASPGCENCYSCTNNARKLPLNGTGLPFDRRSRDLVDPFVDEKILAQPIHWRKHKLIFVENQSDLFGAWVPDEQIDAVFAVMAAAQWHSYQVLTKQSARMLAYMTDPRTPERIGEILTDKYQLGAFPNGVVWPIRSVWLGVSAEDQKRADERIPDLIATPAAKRFVSYEPALGPIDLTQIANSHNFGEGQRWYEALKGYAWEAKGGDYYDICIGPAAISWVISGGESGPGAGPTHPEWHRSARDQCADAGVPFFFKQWGAYEYILDAEDGYHAFADDRELCYDAKKRCKVVHIDGTVETPESNLEWWNREFPEGAVIMRRVGKKVAGSVLDDVEHKEFPIARRSRRLG